METRKQKQNTIKKINNKKKKQKPQLNYKQKT